MFSIVTNIVGVIEKLIFEQTYYHSIIKKYLNVHYEQETLVQWG